ncbi:hypothetical protein [Actinoplanes subtropicus]|uniref:hypothetical protein n=1 Tax=Actinoplanes subtropicus TaxID=543632 RepID=UPI000A88C617|nr:hypothetical protein [Actinoplanes subtropicus]
MTERAAPRCAGRRKHRVLPEEPSVADLLFVVLTVALFAALTVLIRAVERW